MPVFTPPRITGSQRGRSCFTTFPEKFRVGDASGFRLPGLAGLGFRALEFLGRGLRAAGSNS